MVNDPTLHIVPPVNFSELDNNTRRRGYRHQTR